LSKFNIAEQFETARTEPEDFIEVGITWSRRWSAAVGDGMGSK